MGLELLDDESFTGCVGVFQGHDICFSELLNTILGVFFLRPWSCDYFP